MLFVHVVDREIDERLADRCSDVLFEWADGAGAGRWARPAGSPVQQIDTGAFADDERQHGWLADAGFDRGPHLVADEPLGRGRRRPSWCPTPRGGSATAWSSGWCERQGDGLPDEADLRAVHDVLEGAFTDHFNSAEETFHEFIHRLREDPGHRWDHWWLAEITDGDEPEPAGALVGTVERVRHRPRRVLRLLPRRPRVRPRPRRGQGAAPHDHRRRRRAAAATASASRSTPTHRPAPTGSTPSMGWGTKYVTESWHRDVPVS